LLPSNIVAKHLPHCTRASAAPQYGQFRASADSGSLGAKLLKYDTGAAALSISVWGGVTLWRSLMRLDLIDEWHLGLHPYVADEGTRLFDDVPGGYRLDLISSTELKPTGILELQYRRHREEASG